MITTLTNSGTISGGNGGAGVSGGPGGAGGAGLSEFRHDHDADQQRDDPGRRGRKRRLNRRARRRDLQHRPSASIGPIANSGSIIGNVVIDNQSNVTVTGGSGSTSAA